MACPQLLPPLADLRLRARRGRTPIRRIFSTSFLISASRPTARVSSTPFTGTDAHADETVTRAGAGNVYLHVACTEYLTAMHIGDRTTQTIDAGGVRPAFTGVLVRDGYNGYTHLDHVLHACCGAHLLRDLRSVHDGDPEGQLWAKAMADTHLDAKHAAERARADGLDALLAHQLARIRNRYLGALAHGRDANTGATSALPRSSSAPAAAAGELENSPGPGRLRGRPVPTVHRGQVGPRQTHRARGALPHQCVAPLALAPDAA